MVTKPVEEFYERRIRSYSHWLTSDWNTLEKFAKKKNVPTHWVIQAQSFFVESDPTIQRMFDEWFEANFEAIKFRCLGGKGQQGFPYYTISKKRVRCLYCGHEMYEYFAFEHIRRVCKKVPKTKAQEYKRQESKLLSKMGLGPCVELDAV